MKRTLAVHALVVGMFLATSAAVFADNWPQWRGPTNDCISKEKNLPTKWSETETIAWKLPLPGEAGSTPIVWGDRIFLTGKDGKNLVLLCASTDGKELWKKPIGTTAGNSPKGDEGNTVSASSPCTDGKHVFTFDGGSGNLVCFDFEGQEIWKVDLQNRYGKFTMNWGTHTSPLLDGDRLYMQLLHRNAGLVIALNKADGKEIWKVKRETDARAESKESYATPSIWRKGEQEYLVTHGGDCTVAHRLTDGSEIWRVGGLNPRATDSLRLVASPTVSADLIVVPSAKSGPVVGVKPEATGAVNAGSKFEQWRRPDKTPDVSSPLIVDGLVYLCGEGGILYCVDAKTGKDHYAERLHSSRYRASPVYADGHVYCTAHDGVVTVVKVGPKFEKVSENKLPEEIAATPVIADGKIYLRGFQNLYAIGTTKK